MAAQQVPTQQVRPHAALQQQQLISGVSDVDMLQAEQLADLEQTSLLQNQPRQGFLVHQRCSTHEYQQEQQQHEVPPTDVPVQNTASQQQEPQRNTECEASSTDGSTAKQKRGGKWLLEQGPSVENWWLSESEGEGSEGKDQQNLSRSEDPLYDPNADEADEAWAAQQRSGRTTDAILSCPGCFTTLCIDCQQHELYHTQYRAMFIQNCDVKLDQVTQVVQRSTHQRGHRKRRADAAADSNAQQEQQELLHPVCCAVCGTEVGAQDADQVVHFFQVLASEC